MRGQFQENTLTRALLPFRRSPVAIGEAVEKLEDRVRRGELNRSGDQTYAGKVDRGEKEKIPCFHCLTPTEFFHADAGARFTASFLSALHFPAARESRGSPSLAHPFGGTVIHWITVCFRLSLR